MAQMPVEFPVPGEQATASYDWNDIASGQGYKSFYLFSSYASGAYTYHLTSNSSIFSELNVPNSILSSDTDFDSSAFNLPRTIFGDIIINFSCNIVYIGSGGPLPQNYWTGTLYIVDTGGTETSLGTFSTRPQATSTSTPGQYYIQSAIIPVTTKTTIKKGEKIRLTIKGNGSGQLSSYTLITDPSGLIDSSALGTTTINIPFDIEL